MVLYAADISKLAVPVKSVQEKIQKPRKRKQEIVNEPEEIVEEKEIVPPKKKRVVKKKEVVVEPEECVSADDDSQTAVEMEKIAEPEVEKPKAKKRVVKKKEVVPEIIPEKIEPPKPVNVPAVEKPKRVKKPKEDTSPPAWFQKYVQSVKKEESMLKTEKVPAKQVKVEAQEQAQKSWNDGLTRDRVSNEVDNHSNYF